MKRTRKKVNLEAKTAELRTGLRGIFVEQPKEWIATARERLKDLPKTNFDLGCTFAARDQWFDAMFRFRVTLYLDKNYPQALYNLGCCYVRLNKTAEAKQTFLAILKKNPADQDALFMLATIDPKAVPGNQQPQHMPAEMVSGFFGRVAEGYDVAEADSKYQAGAVIHELARPLVKVAAPRVLDLACGSGIVARPWRAEAASIHGVDMTREMIALAGAATHADKKLYDSLTLADVAKLPPEVADASADVVLLINAAHFVGELSSVMQGAAKALAPQGVFVITLEPYTGASGFGLMRETSRFGHTTAYAQQVASAAGLVLVKETPIELYAGTPAQAMVYSKGIN
ncbi:MAG: methyltransferase domain-containing protein [Rickettsiales bacterium]